MTKEDLKETAMKKAIGMRFKQFREFLKKSQAELAEELQVRQAIISAIETGKIFPGFPVQHYLNNRYRLDINWLINGFGEMIIPGVKESKSSPLLSIFHRVRENDPRFEHDEELKKMIENPLVEEIILGKLAELKAIAPKGYRWER